MISTQTLLQATNLFHKLGSQVILDGINFSLSKGESVSIMGESGSGKSTLLQCLGGMTKPKGGSVHYAGSSIYEDSSKKLAQFRGETIGFVFQDFKLLPQLTVLENVLLPTEHLNDRDQYAGRANDLLIKLGIHAISDKVPRQISGGQAQRCAIARALIRNPDVIMADEPTGNLDDENGAIVIDTLLGLADEGKAVIMVTHNRLMATRFHRVAQLRNGKLV